MSKEQQNHEPTSALQKAGRYLDEHDIRTNAGTVIGAVNRALQEERPVAEVLEEVLADE